MARAGSNLTVLDWMAVAAQSMRMLCDLQR